MARITYPLLKAFDSDGKPLVGGKVHTYVKDSNTRTVTYADFSKTADAYHRNPIILNADGEAKVFRDRNIRYLERGVAHGLSGVLTPAGGINQFDAVIAGSGNIFGRNVSGNLAPSGSISPRYSGMELEIDDVEDDFSDADRSFNILWTVTNAPFGTVSIQSEKLHWILDWIGSGQMDITSNAIWIGNFNVQVDFDNTNLPDPQPESRYWESGIEILGEDTGEWSGAYHHWNETGDPVGNPQYFDRIWNGGAGGYGTPENTADLSGKLRVARVSDVVTNYYWNGAIWVQLGDAVNYGSQNVKIRIRIIGTPGQAPYWLHDNFQINQADRIILA